MAVTALSGQRWQGSGSTSPYTCPTTVTGNQEIDVSSILADPFDNFVSPDGVYLFLTSAGGTGSGVVNRATMSTPFDITTADLTDLQTYDYSNRISFGAMWFNPAGTRLFICNKYADGTGDTDYIYQYNLSSAWDLTSIASTPDRSYDVGLIVASPSAIAFNPDGTRFFVGKYNDGVHIYEFTCNAFELTSVSAVGNEDITGSIEHYSMSFLNEGKSLIIPDKTNDNIVSYKLGTAYDISTVDTTAETTLDVSSVNTDPNGLCTAGGIYLYV